MPEPHPAVAAILAVTPIHPVRGDVITEWVYNDSHPLTAQGYRVVHPWRPVQGDPTPVAARQAAAVLRWLIAHAEENGWRTHGQMMLDNIATLADEIEEAHHA